MRPDLPWLAGLDVVELDSGQLRALAHPTRSRILTSLRLEGPATSSILATRLGSNSGQTSYHLRALADIGLVVEDTSRGTVRERWWRSAHRGHSWSQPDEYADTEERHAADWLLRHWQRTYAQWVSEWFDLQGEWPAEWRVAAQNGDSSFMATAELLAEFGDELHALLNRFRLRGDELDPADPNVHRVTAIYHAFPSEHVRP